MITYYKQTYKIGDDLSKNELNDALKLKDD